MNEAQTGQMGQVVGTYQDSSLNYHGFVCDPLAGVCDTADCIGFTDTQLWGINNAGVAVGNATDADGNIRVVTTNIGPLSDSCYPAPTCFPAPSGICNEYTQCPGNSCSGYAINDAGWIAGYVSGDLEYPSPVDGYFYDLGAVWKNSTDPPVVMEQLGIGTYPTGINGQGLITGWYDWDDVNYYDFIADASQASMSAEPTEFGCLPAESYTSSFAQGINNNGQVGGYSFPQPGGAGFLFDGLNGGGCVALGDLLAATGLNDDAQIVGMPWPWASGFVLVPQN